MKIIRRIKEIWNEFLYNHAGNKGRAEILTNVKGVKIGIGGDINKNVKFGSEPYLISLGDNVRITSGVKFCTHDGGVWVIRHMIPEEKSADVFGRIVVGNNVHIGWDTIIMPNVTIGNNVIIGAGAIVTHDIPDNCVAAGVPARVISSIEEYYKKNKDKMVDTKHMSYKDKKSLLENMNN